MADDTTGRPIGDLDRDIFKAYRCVNLTTSQTVAQSDSLASGEIVLYPLNDGVYRLQIWGYDTEGNGKEDINPQTIRFIVYASQLLVPGNRWYMMTVPRPIQFRWDEFLADSLIKLFRWNNQENRYLPVLYDGTEAQKMGAAFWIFPTGPLKLDARGYPQATAGDSLITDIETGWNQVGLPVGYKTLWRDMSFYSQTANRTMSLEQAVADKIISPAVYWYRHNKKLQGYEWATIDTVSANPWRGYWFKSNHDGQLIFTHKPAFQTIQQTVAEDSTQNLARNSTDWEVAISLRNEIYMDARNVFGISQTGKDYPVFEPPHFADFCSFFFESEFGPLTRNLQAPFKDFDEVKTWDITVESRNGQLEHELNWSMGQSKGNIPFLYLVDLQKEEIINMAEQSRYLFTPEKGTYHFVIYATQDASFSPKIIPLEFKLSQNYPNPFNPKTTIRFGIPENADGQRVTLKVFNVLGQEIATLIDQDLSMGYHEVEWNSTNRSGQMVSSGVYFYNLSTGKETIVRKMILVR
jgi:hypothetical protein